MTVGVIPQKKDVQPDRTQSESSSRSKRCLKHAHSPRNLVVCIDGTSNQFGSHNTSVIELYYMLPKSTTQITYYNSGIGTFARPSWKSLAYWKQLLENKIDLAIAWNLEKIIIDAYRWLSEMYEDGDRIFLFGFSRGAYQVRALSAMIDKVGLIHKGNQGQIPFAYELYADPINNESPLNKTQAANGKEKEAYEKNTARFKAAFSRQVHIHFVGVWDTVSSVGAIRGRTLPGTTTGMQHVCHFRHALALDERRVKFLPEFAYGGSTISPEGPMKGHLDAKEVWFAGTHSDIGGGNAENADMNRSGPPLMWMMSEAVTCGLRLSTTTSESWKWENTHPPYQSLSGVWWLLEALPMKRLSYLTTFSITRWPHWGRGRTIVEGQRIHGSVVGAQFIQPKVTGRLLGFLAIMFSRSGGSAKLTNVKHYTPGASLPTSATGKSWEYALQDQTWLDQVAENDLYHATREFSELLDQWAAKDSLSEGELKAVKSGLLDFTKSDVERWALGVMPSASRAILTIMRKNSDKETQALLFRCINSIHRGAGRIGDFGVFLPFDERLLPLWQNVDPTERAQDAASRPRGITWVEDPSKAELELVLTPSGHIEFHILDAATQELGVPRMPFQEDIVADRIYQILQSAADFYFHLRQAGPGGGVGFASQVAFEFIELNYTGELYDNFNEILEPLSDNMNHDGLVTVEVEEGDGRMYGFKLVNSSPIHLYAYIFYFDLGDLSIKHYYVPHVDQSGHADWSIMAGSSLTIGYGSDWAHPYAYFLPEGQDADVGFLKVYLSNEPIDFTVISQESPFEAPQLRTTPLKLGNGQVWDSFTVAIAQKRKSADDRCGPY